MLAADYPFLDLVWTMVIFFLWIVWFWLLFTVWFDVFRRHDLSGLGKAGWLLFTIFLPFLGVFVYVNDGQGRWEKTLSVGGPEDSSYSLALADVDRDGHMDIVAGTVERPNAVFLGNSLRGDFRQIRFGKAVTEGVSYGLAVGDLNRDRWPDVAVARSGEPSRIYLSSGVSSRQSERR